MTAHVWCKYEVGCGYLWIPISVSEKHVVSAASDDQVLWKLPPATLLISPLQSVKRFGSLRDQWGQSEQASAVVGSLRDQWGQSEQASAVVGSLRDQWGQSEQASAVVGSLRDQRGQSEQASVVVGSLRDQWVRQSRRLW